MQKTLVLTILQLAYKRELKTLFSCNYNSFNKQYNKVKELQDVLNYLKGIVK